MNSRKSNNNAISNRLFSYKVFISEAGKKHERTLRWQRRMEFNTFHDFEEVAINLQDGAIIIPRYFVCV